jgi:hypothetical protein
MEFLNRLVENRDEDSRQILLRAMVCILAQDVKLDTYMLRKQRSAEILEKDKKFLREIQIVLCDALEPSTARHTEGGGHSPPTPEAIEIYCQILDILEMLPSELLTKLAAAPAVPQSIKTLLCNRGYTYEGGKLDDILASLIKSGFKNEKDLNTMFYYCGKSCYREYLSSTNFGLVDIIINGYYNSQENPKHIYILQKLISPRGEIVDYIIEKIINPSTSQSACSLCCSLFCSLLAKDTEKIVVSILIKAQLFPRLVHFINNFTYGGGGGGCNTPKGWSVYIILLSITNAADTDAIAAMDILLKHNIVGAFMRIINNPIRDESINLLTLLSLISLMFLANYKNQFIYILETIPGYTYKLIVDILDNIVHNRKGPGYGEKTFTLELVIKCIYYMTLMESINANIINIKLISLLRQVIELHGGANIYGNTWSEIITYVMYTLEYAVPYCINYDYHNTELEIKKIAGCLAVLQNTEASSAAAAAHKDIINYIINISAASQSVVCCLPLNDIKTVVGAAVAEPFSNIEEVAGGVVDDALIPVAIPIVVPDIAIFEDCSGGTEIEFIRPSMNSSANYPSPRIIDFHTRPHFMEPNMHHFRISPLL